MKLLIFLVALWKYSLSNSSATSLKFFEKSTFDSLVGDITEKNNEIKCYLTNFSLFILRSSSFDDDCK